MLCRAGSAVYMVYADTANRLSQTLGTIQGPIRTRATVSDGVPLHQCYASSPPPHRCSRLPPRACDATLALRWALKSRDFRERCKTNASEWMNWLSSLLNCIYGYTGDTLPAFIDLRRVVGALTRVIRTENNRLSRGGAFIEGNS